MYLRVTKVDRKSIPSKNERARATDRECNERKRRSGRRDAYGVETAGAVRACLLLAARIAATERLSLSDTTIKRAHSVTKV